MKKALVLVTLLFSFAAKAQFNLNTLFDVPKISEGALIILDSLNESAEKVHVIQKENVNLEAQWLLVCNNAVQVQSLANTMNMLFKAWSLNTKTCLPITHVIDLQNVVIENCANFYTKSVPMNSGVILEALALSYEESKKVINECKLF